jgi:GT2 family glycosyltransferase
MYLPSVDIVVLSYNRIEELRKCLSILRALSYTNYQVIVVDNCSTDGSCQMVKNEFPVFKLIEMNENAGVSKGRNAGFKVCTGDFIVYLDDDSFAPQDICERTIQHFQSQEDAGCLAFLIWDLSNKEYSNQSNVDNVANYHGAGHAFRHDLIKQINYLDEDYFFGGEEIDSSLRLMKLGCFVKYCPDIEIKHVARTRNMSIDQQYFRSVGYIKTFGMFYLTHFPKNNAIKFLLRMFLSFLKHGVVRLKKPFLPFDGFYQLWKLRSKIRLKRAVAAKEIVAFYSNPACEPRHYSRPMIHKSLF